MDPQRFDRLARLFATGTTRRAIFRSLFAVGGILSLTTARPRVGRAACLSDSDCSGGVCCEDGSCTPGVAKYECCVTDGNPNEKCPTSAIYCVDGTCRSAQCESDQDCSEGICCGGQCTGPNAECCSLPGDTHCAPYQTCFEAVCDPRYCTDDTDCPGICCEGFCQPSTAECCSVHGDTHCAPHETCFEAVCDPRYCTDDANCPGVCCDGFCQPVTVECCSLPGDTHCAAHRTCIDGVCQIRQCTNDADCPGICCDGQCDPVTAECCGPGRDAAHCPAGNVCTMNLTCVPTDQCKSDADCPGICCDDGCRPLADECCGRYDIAHCGKNRVCLEDNICVPISNPVCDTDQDCYQGGICCGGVCTDRPHGTIKLCCNLDEDPEARCLPASHCVNGTCFPDDVAGRCCEARMLGLTCAANECCVSALVPGCPNGSLCVETTNQEGVCCVPQGKSCLPSTPCCGDLTCDDNSLCSPVGQTPCDTDTDCGDGICCGGSCIPWSHGAIKVCCSLDADPDARCATDFHCVNNSCIPENVAGHCCEAQMVGLACAANECCGIAADPDAMCPTDSVCVETTNQEGVCCVPEGKLCQASTPCCSGLTCANDVCGAVDKWGLWTAEDESLLGATLYLRRVTADDDPTVMSEKIIGPDYQQPDFDRLAADGANFVILSHPAIVAEGTPFSLEPDVQEHLEHLTRHAGRAALYCVVSIRTGPGRPETVCEDFPICQAGGCFSGGVAAGQETRAASPLWTDAKAQDAWVEQWRTLADRLKGNPVVIGYHLMAMPDAPDAKTYLALMQRIAAAIREVDADTPLLISPLGPGTPADLADLTPIADQRTIYLIGAFSPTRYLLQSPDDPAPLIYGDEFDPATDGETGQFGRDWLAGVLAPATTWASDNKRPVAVGGYGMPRWQPGLASYLTDLLSLFSEATLRTALWLWHPVKGPTEDDAFNLEHGPNPATHELTENKLIDLLVDYWSEDAAIESGGPGG